MSWTKRPVVPAYGTDDSLPEAPDRHLLEVRRIVASGIP